MKVLAGAACALLLLTTVVGAQSTRVPGQHKSDADDNGYPDAGIEVNGHYTALYAYDAYGMWFWDLGDGRTQGNATLAELDPATLTTCDYEVNYRGTFENDPFLDSGWIFNSINCSGNFKAHYQDLIVHSTDPRYTGNPEWAIWGDWEYHTYIDSGIGNYVRRFRP